MEITFKDLFVTLKKGVFAPIYLLHGEEPYYIDEVSNFLEQKMLQPAEKDFNQSVLYGKDTSAADIVGLARRFPISAERQLIVVKEAQELRDLDALEIYIQKPVNTTTLVLCHKNKTLDKRKKIYGLLKTNGTVMPSDKIRDYQMGAWIETHIKSKGGSASPDAVMLLTEFLGNNLTKIGNELDKIWINQPITEKISAQTIEKFIGISRQFSVFELQNALGKHDKARCYEIALQMANNPKINNFSLVGTIAALYGYFAKLCLIHHLHGSSSEEIAKKIGVHPFITKEYISAARYYNLGRIYAIFKTLLSFDARAKGVSGSSVSTEGNLFLEMMYKLLATT